MKRALTVPAALAILLAASSASAAGPLSDRVEPVIIKASSLPECLRGGEIPSYRVFSWNGAELAPIIMQIDEVDDQGEVILKQGPEAVQGDGRFDGNDELVFMAFDAGSPYEGDAPAGCATTANVTMSDARTGATSLVVVARCEDPPPKASGSYVDFNYPSREVYTSAYHYGWGKEMSFYYNQMRVGKGPDVLDRLKVRIYVGKWGIEFEFNEQENFVYRYHGHTSGPVRTTTRASNKVKMGPLGLIWLPQKFFFYRDYIVMINFMDSSMNPAVLGLDFRVAIGHDLTLDPAKGYRICMNALPQCQLMADKLPPERIKELNEQHTIWGGFDGPDGSLISYFVPDKRLTTRVHSIYIDDPEISLPPEEFVGSSPLISFNVIDWQDVKGGVYNLDFYHFFMKKYSASEVERFARFLNDPLRVAVE